MILTGAAGFSTEAALWVVVETLECLFPALKRPPSEATAKPLN
jgi:hypothetical protein